MNNHFIYSIIEKHSKRNLNLKRPKMVPKRLCMKMFSTLLQFSRDIKLVSEKILNLGSNTEGKTFVYKSIKLQMKTK